MLVESRATLFSLLPCTLPSFVLSRVSSLASHRLGYNLRHALRPPPSAPFARQLYVRRLALPARDPRLHLPPLFRLSPLDGEQTIVIRENMGPARCLYSVDSRTEHDLMKAPPRYISGDIPRAMCEASNFFVSHSLALTGTPRMDHLFFK